MSRLIGHLCKMSSVFETNNFLSRKACIMIKIITFKAKFRKPVPVKWVLKSKEDPDISIWLKSKKRGKGVYAIPRSQLHKAVFPSFHWHINVNPYWIEIILWRRIMGILIVWYRIRVPTSGYASWDAHIMARSNSGTGNYREIIFGGILHHIGKVNLW